MNVVPYSDNEVSLNFNDSLNSSQIILNTNSVEIWHDHLGHINLKKISRLSYLSLIPKLNVHPNSNCEICVQ